MWHPNFVKAFAVLINHSIQDFLTYFKVLEREPTMDDPTQNEGEKTIKIIEFKGKGNEFRMWSRKFLARATLKGYKLTLLGKTNVPKHDEELSGNSAEVKKKSNARKANNMA